MAGGKAWSTATPTWAGSGSAGDVTGRDRPHPYTACAEHLGHAHSAEADAATASRQQRAASRMRVARLPATPDPF